MNNNWGPTVFNTWVGDPVRLVVLDAILDTVAEDNLCDNATQTGDYIQSELRVSQPILKITNGTQIKLTSLAPSSHY